MNYFRFALAVLFVAGTACAKKKAAPADTTLDSHSPAFGSAASVSNLTGTGFTLTWSAATDDATAQASLKYKVVISTSNNISTVASAETNGTLVMDYTVNTLTTNVSALSGSTVYYYAILAEDDESTPNKGIIHGTATTLCAGKIMFITSVNNGNFGGPAGGDTICNSNKPTGFGGSTFKAMVADSTTRAACYVNGNDSCSSSTTGRMDWVFTANETICTSDYSKKVGTTDGLALLHSTANTLSSSPTTTFTGMNIAWGTSTANNCTGWTSTGGAAAVTGSANFNGQDFYAHGSSSCNSAATIYCVEQ